LDSNTCLLVLQDSIEHLALHERLRLRVAQRDVLVADLRGLIPLGRTDGRVRSLVDGRHTVEPDPDERRHCDGADAPHEFGPDRHRFLHTGSASRDRL
jgi:hypothetical protein